MCKDTEWLLKEQLQAQQSKLVLEVVLEACSLFDT